MSGTGGGECFLSPFHFMYQDYSKIFCIPMLHAAHGRLVVKLLHSDWCRKYFRDQRFLGVIVRPTVTRSYRFYPISSRYVSVLIIRKHWKQEHWRYIVGDFLGFSNCRAFFRFFKFKKYLQENKSWLSFSLFNNEKCIIYPPSRSIVSPSVTSQTGCKAHCTLISCREGTLKKSSITTALSFCSIHHFI